MSHNDGTRPEDVLPPEGEVTDASRVTCANCGRVATGKKATT